MKQAFLILDHHQAARIARMTKVVSTDTGRPMLTCVNLEWDTDPAYEGTPEYGHKALLHIVGTDSYRIGIHRMTVSCDKQDFEPGKAPVYAKALAGAIDMVLKHQKATANNDSKRIVVSMEWDINETTKKPDPVTVWISGSIPTAPTQTVEGYPHSEFPKWRSLIGDLDDHAMDRAPWYPAVNTALQDTLVKLEAYKNTDDREEDNLDVAIEALGQIEHGIGQAGLLPQFQPDLFKQGLDSLGTLVEMRDRPVQLVMPNTEHRDLRHGHKNNERNTKAFGFRTSDKHGEYWYLQMPTNI